jgi:type IV secretory pathway VirD2 relaxase
MSSTSRRVVVKIRYAANAGGRAAPLKAHVAYLSREAASQKQAPEITPGEQTPAHDPTQTVDYLSRAGEGGTPAYAFFDGANSNIDGRAVTQGWTDDPRHFRMIVSAEDGEALGDLKPFIRELIAGLETRLGTKLEWLAVNHHDTDNPHTHVLIRGRRPDGQELFIPSRLISSGIREQAQEIVTRVLGPRLAIDLERERFRDISLRAPTPLDRELLAAARSGPFLPARADLVARLERLEGWGLAERSADGWRLDANLASKLRSMAERDDVERVVGSVRTESEHLRLLEADRSSPVVGELIHVGPVDELDDRLLVVIETGGGELRYARFERSQDLAMLAGAQPGALVSIEPNVPETRPSDEAVARISGQTGGVYSAGSHAELEPHADRRVLEANMRRLEAMRRAGLVQRTGNGEFLVGRHHLDNAMAFEERMVARAPFSVRIASYWSLAEQVAAPGLTHLDRVLAGQADGPTGSSRFVRDFEHALQQRRLVLIEQGWMSEQDKGLSRRAGRKTSSPFARSRERSPCRISCAPR